MSTQFDPDAAPRFLLDFLISRYPAPFALDDLAREYAGSDDISDVRFLVEEGIAALAGCGLVHSIDRFVFASWSAVRAQELLR